MPKIDLSRIHWPQVVVLVALIASVALVLIFAPPEVIAKLPWQAILGGAGAAGAGVLASFLGSIVKPAEAPAGPDVPTTPAREARAGLRTIRGDEPVDQDAVTKPGGGV